MPFRVQNQNVDLEKTTEARKSIGQTNILTDRSRERQIARQAEDAQFMVVSHRRPMIGAAERTIGVTQARGAHTQVVGLPDAA